MKNANSQITRPAKILAVAAVAFSVCGFAGTMHGAEPAFDGGKSTWHDGFVRYDFTMDDETLAITRMTQRRRLWTIWSRWPKRAFRSCTFAAASIRGSTARRGWRRRN